MNRGERQASNVIQLGGALIFLVGGSLLLGKVTVSYLSARRMANLPTVTGTITSSTLSGALDSSNGVDGTLYLAEIVFDYTVQGVEYTNKLAKLSDSESECRQLVKRYQEGEAVTVFYSPNVPGNSLLDPYRSVGLLDFVMAICACVILLAGAGASLKALRALRTRQVD